MAKKVILVHRRDTLRATKIYHEPLEQTENVEFRWNSTVSALLSGDRLTGVRLRDTVTGEESVVDCDGVFAVSYTHLSRVRGDEGSICKGLRP